jgi:hypothetical protein
MCKKRHKRRQTDNHLDHNAQQLTMARATYYIWIYKSTHASQHFLRQDVPLWKTSCTMILYK